MGGARQSSGPDDLGQIEESARRRRRNAVELEFLAAHATGADKEDLLQRAREEYRAGIDDLTGLEQRHR